MARFLSLMTALVLCNALPAQPSATSPDPLTPRPIDVHDTVFLEEMTWMEVRDALKAGKTTIIVATGGVEQNGPYLATGKHNYVIRPLTEAIARKLGNCLIAPIVPFVPEGDINPPSLHMKYPGTISLSEDTFQRLLTDICTSLQTHGFRDVVLLGDSAGNQAGMKAVASNLNSRGGDRRVHFIAEFYDYPSVKKWLDQQGIVQKDEGLHDDFAMTAQMMVVDPTTVRMKQRLAAQKFHINGVALAPADKTIEWGKRIIDFRADATVKAIQKATAKK